MKKRLLVLFAVMALLLFAAPLAVQADTGTVDWVSYSVDGTDWTYPSNESLSDISKGYKKLKCHIGGNDGTEIELGDFNRPVKNENLVYTGQPQALITADSGTITPNTAGVTAHYEYQVVNGTPSYEEIDSTKWSSEKTQATDPGIYYVWVRLVVNYGGTDYYLDPSDYTSDDDFMWSSWAMYVEIKKSTLEYPIEDGIEGTVKIENFDAPTTYAELQTADFAWDDDFDVYVKPGDTWIKLDSTGYTYSFYDTSTIVAGEKQSLLKITINETSYYNGYSFAVTGYIKGNELKVTTELSTPELTYDGSEQELIIPFAFEDPDAVSIEYLATRVPLDSNGDIPDDLIVYYDDYQSYGINSKYWELCEEVQTYKNNIPTGTESGCYIIYYTISDVGNAYEEDDVIDALYENTDENSTVFDNIVTIISPKTLTAEDVTISLKQETATVQWGELTLEQGTDYTVTSSFSEGTGNICINFNKEDYAGNYLGKIDYTYKGTGNETGITFVSDAENLVDTLTKAAAGDLVILADSIADAEGCYLAVRSGVTLDLNGKSITGAELFYVTGSIKDTGSAKGLVSAEAYFINSGQEYIPIYSTSGYSFYKLGAEAKTSTDADTGKTTYKFRINTGSDDYAALKALITDQSAADFTANSKLKVTAVFSWTDGNGAVSQTVTYSSGLLQEYFADSDTRALTLSVTGINSITSKITLQFNLVAVSPEGNDLAAISIAEPITIQEAQ